MRFTLREWTVVAVSLLLCTVLIALNNWYSRSRSQRIATVDMRVVLQAKQKQVGDILIMEGATDDMRKAAVDSATGYAARVERVLDEILEQCQCVLVSKDLVVAGSAARDYTANVLARLSGELGMPIR